MDAGGTGPESERSARRNALVLGAVLAICLAGAGLLGWWLRQAYLATGAGDYEGLDALEAEPLPPGGVRPADG